MSSGNPPSSGNDAEQPVEPAENQASESTKLTKPTKPTKPGNVVVSSPQPTKQSSSPRRPARKRGKRKRERPWSAYQHFADEMRPIIQREKPDLSVSDITRVISLRWRLTDDRSKWNELAYNDREAYTAAGGSDGEFPDPDGA